MSIDVVRSNLLYDTVSSTASYVYTNLNSNGYYSSPAAVPRYIYTSLAELCSGFTGGNLNKAIVSDYGTSVIPAGGAIILQPDGFEESAEQGWIPQDESGAEYSYNWILVQNVKTSTDVELIKDIGLRIRYVLDSNLRSLMDNQFMAVHSGATWLSPDLDVSADNSINRDSPYKVSWEHSGILRASQQAHRYRSVYWRTFT